MFLSILIFIESTGVTEMAKKLKSEILTFQRHSGLYGPLSKIFHYLSLGWWMGISHCIPLACTLTNFFMQWNLEKYTIERRKVTVSAKVSLNLKSDIYFHGRSFSRNFSFEIKRLFEKFMRYASRLLVFEFPFLNHIQDLTSFLHFVFSLSIVL